MPRSGLLPRLRELLVRFELHRVDAVRALLPASGDLLDVGCGAGRLLAGTARGAGRRVGLDLSADACRAAASALTAAGHAPLVLQAGLQALPFRDGAFDAVSAVAVLQYAVDPYAAFAELHRVLKPGGTLVVQVPNLGYVAHRLALLAGHLPRHSTAPGWDGGTLHAFTAGSLAHALEASGFHLAHLTGSGVLAPLRAWWPALLTGDLIAVATRA